MILPNFAAFIVVDGKRREKITRKRRERLALVANMV